MQSETGQFSSVQAILDGARQGGEGWRAALIECSCARLLRLCRRMLHDRFPQLRRWEDTNDVLQQVVLRLERALEKMTPGSARQFYGLAAEEIRRELIDLSRHYFGPQGLGANYESDYGGGPAGAAGRPRREPEDDTSGPATLTAWTEFHEQVGTLPEEEREVFDLLWYQQLSQRDAAAVLGVSVRTVKRRWQRAKLHLYEALGGQPPN